ncbi:hypothetical protein C0V97_06710 [Asaia sp. W19]|nr:hypothetical protein C0V97_06710 [Asaia sp. W19]
MLSQQDISNVHGSNLVIGCILDAGRSMAGRSMAGRSMIESARGWTLSPPVTIVWGACRITRAPACEIEDRRG